MTKSPFVSVIITTRNEYENIAACLESVKGQIYKNYEIIVVDNNSTDDTKKIANNYTKNVFNFGPERSAQRNYGAKIAKGQFLLFLDADMQLTSNVIQECADIAHKNSDMGGIIIPEESFGESFWAKAKALERSFYLEQEMIEAARFYPKKIFEKLGGFSENITGPEDWDLSQRVRKNLPIYRIKSFIRHNEGTISLLETIRKKYYYAKKFHVYLENKDNKTYASNQLNIFVRYSMFFSKPKKLFKDPLLGISMLFMKTCEFAAGGCGYLLSMLK